MKSIPVWICAAAAACTAWAVETKVWKQSEAADFEKGKRQGLALSSDGALSLAPAWKRLADLETPLVWSLLPGPDGSVYAGAGDGKVYRIDAQGRRTVFAELGSGAVYALAAGAGGAVYAGLSPEGKVFRIGPDGRPALHAQLEPRYIWALAPGEGGALFAATGDPGQIVRIAADGKTSVFFDAAESHVRSLARDARGNLIIGTEPGGAVLRIDPKGQGFVLHQTGKREVTAIVTAADGTVYAAAAGTRRPPSGQPAPSAVTVQTAQVQTQPSTPQPQPQPQAPSAQAQRPAAAPPPAIGVAAQAAGSEIWRIAPDGEPRLLWSNNTVTVYALALDAQGALLAGAGSDGVVYCIDTPQAWTTLVEADPQQVTALVPAPGGGVLAATANPGMVYRLGPELEKTGTLESEVLDAGAFTYWGRLRHEAELNGGRVRIETRSGNLEDPGRSWSPWEEVSAARGERIASPPARFLQYRAILEASPSGASPRLRLIEAAYQAKNLAPVIEKIEITPFNYRFPAPSATLTASRNLTLPALGGAAQRRSPAAQQPTPTENTSVTMNYEKGWIGVRWRAYDPNSDGLEARIEIRGEGERDWKPLKAELRESRYSWDSTAFADGRYRLRVTLSDRPDNYPGEELSSQMESEEFLIDNTPPEILDLKAQLEGGKIVVRFRVRDALSALQYAEACVNGGDWVDAEPSTRITDSQQHDYEVSLPKPAGSEFVIAVRAADERDNVAVRRAVVR